ncbi:CapA family protein [Paenibacillus qinlingensis]|uniref:CapA family protein n=1 Tax=Paenibacillus qinlingensis TaxID=1837343 RepID=UPI0015647F0D|nr:CapA family protein [Paenibacillus qinlingensis]NQX57723.1 CapA family protein [Paenibacillus qinlingensis]
MAVCISSLFVGCEAAWNPSSLGVKSIPINSKSNEVTQELNNQHVSDPSPMVKMTESIEDKSRTPASDVSTNGTDISTNVVYVQPTPIEQFNSEPLHILYAGDAMFDWSVKEAINRYGPDYPFLHIQSDIEQADFSFVNLETAVTQENEKDTNQIYNFKSNPESLTGLKNAGFDMVSVANNHSMDFLQKGFLDTLTHLDTAGLLYVGGGLNAQEAYRAKSVNLKGKIVKFLAFSRFIPTGDWFAGKNKPGIAQAYDRKPVLDAIAREREGADYVLVYLHWGVEMNNRPEAWQREFAKQMIDAGADAIIGSHVHVLQGFEYYKGKPIAYSIGNFLFPDYVTGPKADTGLLHLKLDEEQIEMSFQPFYIEKNQIVSKGSVYVEKQLAYLTSISYGVALEGQTIRPEIGIASK